MGKEIILAPPLSLSFIYHQSPSPADPKPSLYVPFTPSPPLLFSLMHLCSYHRHLESHPSSSLASFQSIHHMSINEQIISVKHNSYYVNSHFKTLSNFLPNVFRRKFNLFILTYKVITIWPRCCRQMYFFWPHTSGKTHIKIYMLGFSQKIKNIWQYMGLPSQWQHQATVRNSRSFGPCLCSLVCHSLHSPCCILLTSSLTDLVCLASATIFVCDLRTPS